MHRAEGYPLQSPETHVVYLSFDTLEVPYETITQNANLNALTITNQPSPITTNVGGDAVFSVEVVGTPPLRFQWNHDTHELNDGANIKGTRTSELKLSALGLDQQGNYWVKVTDGTGQSSRSSNATLTVNVTAGPAPQPIAPVPSTGTNPAPPLVGAKTNSPKREH